MGTNYYWTPNYKPPCAHCGRAFEQEKQIHIGKSSGGWCFSLHVTDYINDLVDWREIWKAGTIFDEYDREISVEKMLEIITEREWASNDRLTPQWLHENHAEVGPNGLARHKVDGKHCIAQGHGTWDLLPGEFS